MSQTHQVGTTSSVHTRQLCGVVLRRAEEGARKLARRRIHIHLIRADDEFVLAITAQLERKAAPSHALVGHAHPGSATRSGRDGEGGYQPDAFGLFRFAEECFDNAGILMTNATEG